MNQYLKKVKSRNKYKEFIKVLNGLLQLSEREMEILSLLLQLDVEWPEGFATKNVISSDSRKFIMSSTKVNKNNLVKYINKFKTYGILEESGDGWWGINNTFKPVITGDTIKVTFILDLQND